MKPKVSVLITDLDNTLFDWVGVWFASFDAMISRLSLDSGINREQLLREAKRVHETHGTSEYAFLIEELPSLREKHPQGDLASIYSASIDAYREARRIHLKLYPTVEETLRKLRREGVLIVGYTESMAFYTNYRMRKLRLDGLLDHLFSPPDHELPKGLSAEQIRKYPATTYELNFTKHQHLPRGELKPNPKVLLDIVRSIGATPDECLYVGDSLMKDIAMANSAQIANALAAYGASQQKESYDVLRKVTHWTPETVEKEKATIASGTVKADETLETCFGQILSKFEFARFGSRAADETRITHTVEVWKKTVEVQQHFNEIEMQIRNVAITVLAALFGAAGFALQTEYYVSIVGSDIQIATLILMAALVTVGAFYFMDEVWYHRLLLGAVKHGIRIENYLAARIPEIALSDTIGKASPVSAFGLQIHSKHKMRIFYSLMAIVVAAFLVGSFLMHPVKLSDAGAPADVAVDTPTSPKTAAQADESNVGATGQEADQQGTASDGQQAQPLPNVAPPANEQAGEAPNGNENEAGQQSGESAPQD